MKHLLSQLIFLLITFLLVSSVCAQTLNLAWDSNTDLNVAGYRLYYQGDNPLPPYLGIEAGQGASPSPIDVGAVNTTNVTLPDDGRVYYFTLTAYDKSGYESAYSNVVANYPRPELLEPAQGSSVMAQSVTFSWKHNADPSGTYTYTLVYGTKMASVATVGFWMENSKERLAWLLIIFTALSLLPVSMARRRCWDGLKVLAVGFFSIFLITACGGGGSGSPPVIDPDVEIRTVTGLTSLSYTATDLVPGKTYYWQVAAVEGQKTEVKSDIFMFKTLPKS